MAGWFGPQNGDCSCCGGGECICDQGPFGQCRFKIEVSGAPSGTHPWDSHDQTTDHWVEAEASGQENFNGTFFFDLTITDGCPDPNQTAFLNSFTISSPWTEYKATSSNCKSEVDSTGTITDDVSYKCSFQVDGDSQIFKLELTNTHLGRNYARGFLFSAGTVIEWTTTSNCDKLPSGTETTEVPMTFETGSDDKGNLADPCVGDYTVTNYPLTFKVTAQWS